MTRPALGAILIAVVVAVGEVALTAAATTARSPGNVRLPLLAFVAGPLLFLALIAWRRRTHAKRSRFLFILSVAVASLGLGFLGADLLGTRNEPPNPNTAYVPPLIVSLGQWVVVVAVWIGLVIRESWERREKQTENKMP